MRCSFLLVWLLGCGKDICIRHSDCRASEVCSANGVCALASDGGVADGVADGAADGELASDAAVSDTTEADAGVDAPSDATTEGGL